MTSYTQMGNRVVVPASEASLDVASLEMYVSSVVQSNHSCYILITSGNYPQPSRVVIMFKLCDDLKPNVAQSVGSR
jgi:hypothetical protein